MKSNIHWLNHLHLYNTVKKHIVQSNSVLDIGCGIIPQKLVPTKLHICVEPFIEYVNHLLSHQPPFSRTKYVIINSDWNRVIPLIPPKSVDTIVILDVIEHIPKKEGLKLLSKTVPLARKQVIIGGPIGLTEQYDNSGKDAWGYSGIEYQKHRSGWLPSDFKDGWEVFASKRFHFKDNLGRKLAKPEGAFFAIKNIPYNSNHEKFSNRLKEQLSQWYNNILTQLYYIKQRIIGAEV